MARVNNRTARKTITVGELRGCVKDGVSEFKAMYRLGTNTHYLRKNESEHGIYLIGFPEYAKRLPYDLIVPMRYDKLMTSMEIAKATGATADDVAKAITFYNCEWESVEDRKKYVARVARERQAVFREDHDGKSPFEIDEIRGKAEETHMKKYGGKSPFNSADVREKSRKTMIDRYGVDNILKDHETWEEVRQVMTERYGAPYTLQSEELRAKVLKTMIDRYGVSNSRNIEGMDDRIRATCLRKYGCECPMQNPEIYVKYEKSLKLAGRDGSENERRMTRWLEDDLGLIEGTDFIVHDHDSIGMELDFFFPEKRIAIEVSPAYCHHSNITESVMKPKKPGLHITKRKKCDAAGIELITLFDWMLDKNSMKGKTRPFLKMKLTGSADRVLYGRNVVIREAKSKGDRRDCIRFTEENHFKGAVKSRWWFGVHDRFDGELVGTFSLSAIDGKTLELKRVCWGSGVQVRYGLSKIVSHVASRFGDYDVLRSYSDCDMGNGSSYAKAGFDPDGETRAGLHFVNICHPQDTYSWSVATSWSAKSGVIAKAFGPLDVTNREARQIVETILPHRLDDKIGYMSIYDTGNRRWTVELDKLRA